MLRTDPARFRVHRRQRNHVWLEVVEGDDAGIRVSVPVRHPDNSDAVQQRLLRLAEDDMIKATLVSDSGDETGPDWRVETIHSGDK